MSARLRQTLDVSRLPETALDPRSPAWWGNLLLLVIETMMFGLLVAAYFYLQQNFPQWPPVQPHTMPPIADPLPRLAPSLLNLAVILGSCAPMMWADRSALQRRRRGVDLGLACTILFGVAALAVRWQEFRALEFRWDDNAYASTVWTILSMHALHLIVGTCELALMLLWVVCKGLDDKHARDVHITAIYWYWIVAIWVLLWFIVFMSPRLF
jgi:heme/copper-type cytochrome/quinol oxidase subunit 3